MDGAEQRGGQHEQRRGEERGHGRGPSAGPGADRVQGGGHRVSFQGGNGPIVGAVHRPRDPLDSGFSWGCNAAWQACPCSRRALEQLRLIADDASSAELLAARALAVLDSAVPFDDGALFAVDESSLLFTLLAYRGQAPEAMHAWLRDTYLVAREPGSCTSPRCSGGAVGRPSSTRTATDGSAPSRPRWTPGH